MSSFFYLEVIESIQFINFSLVKAFEDFILEIPLNWMYARAKIFPVNVGKM